MIKNYLKKHVTTDLVKEYLKTGFLFRLPFQIVSSGMSRTGLEMVRLSANIAVYKWLKHRFWQYFDNIDFTEAGEKHVFNKCVWCCWFQGLDNAPDVVKRCHESIKEHLENYKLVMLTEENFRDYVTLPSHIEEKYKAGIITKTHLTDLIRLELLTRYGGVWIDATVLLTGPLPEWLQSSEVFFYRCLKPGRDGHVFTPSSWFISAMPNNKILLATRELMYEYWRRKNTLIDYFLIHLFLQMSLDRFPEEERKMVKCSSSTPHILLLDMFEPFDERTWTIIKSQTPIHKLAYKRTKEEMEKKGTFYDIIINKKQK